MSYFKATNYTCTSIDDCGGMYAGYCNFTSDLCYCGAYFLGPKCTEVDTAPGGFAYPALLALKVFASVVYLPTFVWLILVLSKIKAHNLNTTLKNRVMIMCIISVFLRWLKVLSLFLGEAVWSIVIFLFFDIPSAYLAILCMLFVLLVWLNILYAGPKSKLLPRLRNGIIGGFVIVLLIALTFLVVQTAFPFDYITHIMVILNGGALLVYVMLFMCQLVYHGAKLHHRLMKFSKHASNKQFAKRLTNWVNALLFATILGIAEQIIDNFIEKDIIIIIVAQFIDVVVFTALYIATGGFFSVKPVDTKKDNFFSEEDDIEMQTRGHSESESTTFAGSVAENDDDTTAAML